MKLLAGLTLWVLSTAAAVAELEVRLSSDRIAFDETVELTVTYNGDSAFEPDLTTLQADFDVLGQSRNHHTQIVNGQISIRQILKLVLAPERTGDIQIPAMQYEGVRSEPLTLRVVAAEELEPAARTHFIEVDVSSGNPVVQEQVVYTVRIFQRSPVIDGSLSEPVADGVALERLGTDRSYRVSRDGVEWDVHERRYALFPQRSGPINLSAVRLRARVAVDGNESGFFFNRQTRQIRLRGPEVELDVRPALTGGQWWLPATALVATANWIVDDAPRVGDPITLELTVTAHGTQAAQLPTLEPTESTSARVYLGQSETGSRVLDSGLVSQRRVRHQIVPTNAGVLALDPIEIEWFSTTEGVMKRERVVIDPLDIAGAPEHDTQEPASGGVPETVSPETPAAEPVDTVADSGSSAVAEDLGVQQPSSLATVALWLAAAGVGLLVLRTGTVVMRGLRRHRQQQPVAALRRAAQAMRAGDRVVVQQELCSWAAGVWGEQPRHLLEVSERLRRDGRNSELAERLERLDAALHGEGNGNWQDPDLLRQLRTVRVHLQTDSGADHALPSLGAAWTHLDHIAVNKSE